MYFYSQNNIHKLEGYLLVKSTPWANEIRLLEKVSHYNAYFKYIPWILGIAVCNSLAMNSAHKDSDIDLFIITKQNRLWTARIWMTMLLTILRQRKTHKKHAWKFCLSFFVSEEWLDFSNIAIENDIYLSYWIDTLKPIINRNDIFKKFREVNKKICSVMSPQSWILSPSREKGATHSEIIVASLSSKGEGIQGWGSWVLTMCWDYLEKLLQTIFLPRTKKSFQKLWKPFWVIISPTMLKFHDRDKRKEIRDEIIS